MYGPAKQQYCDQLFNKTFRYETFEPILFIMPVNMKTMMEQLLLHLYNCQELIIL